MPSTTYTITLSTTGPSPNPLTVGASDKVVFTNSMTASTVVTLPQCLGGVKSGDTITIPAAGSSGQYNVTGNPNNAYNYSYSAATVTGTEQTGTIDVS